ARAQPAPVSAAPEAVRRGEPDPGEMGDGRDGPDRGRDAPADVAARGEVPPDGARGSARGGDRAARAARGGRTRLNRKLVAAAALAVLSACASDSGVDYKKAGTLPPLEVPPDLTAPARDNRYAVPEAARSSDTLSGYQAERRDQPARA